MTQSSQLARVCTSCGVKKPLSAFLQLGGAQGTTYGAICSDCRRTVIQPKQPAAKEKDEERSSSSSNLRIGAQQKIAADIEKQQQHKTKRELTHEEAKALDALKAEKLLRDEAKLKAEKDHRVFYIETKKQGFLTGKKLPPTKQILTTEQIKERKADALRKAEASNELTKKRDAAAEHDIKLTTIDLTLPFLDPQSAEIRHQSAMFLQFKQWLGSGAPISKLAIMNSLEQIYDKNFSKQNKQAAPDPVVEQIEKNWGPSSGRKR